MPSLGAFVRHPRQYSGTPPGQHPRTRDERGASAVEYGLIITFIAGVITLAVLALGQVTAGTMGTPCEQLDEGGASSSCE